MRVLPSTAGSSTWVVFPGGCEDPSSNCTDARGAVFDETASTSWNGLGLFDLGLLQNFAGYNQSGAYGLDTLSLGISNATGGPSLESQIIAGIQTSRFYVGMFGLQSQPMNLSDFTQPHQTFLSSLKSQNLTSSLSWAYTAGAKYRSKSVFGSLTFGGADLSRYDPSNSVSFNLAPDVARDLVVGIQTISTTFVNGSMRSLLPSTTVAFIDSTTPYVYLPPAACEEFERQLGLVWDNETNLYFVDDELHERLLLLRPSFTFTLGNDQTSKPTIDITLPFDSFDLTATPPLVPTPTRYIPLRRGQDDQITLGRAFLQEV